MTRAELTRYIFDTYSVEPDYPFSDDNVSAVFRHPANRKSHIWRHAFRG